MLAGSAPLVEEDDAVGCNSTPSEEMMPDLVRHDGEHLDRLAHRYLGGERASLSLLVLSLLAWIVAPFALAQRNA